MRIALILLAVCPLLFAPARAVDEPEGGFEDPFPGLTLAEARAARPSVLRAPPEVWRELMDKGYGAMPVPDPPAQWTAVQYQAPDGDHAAYVTKPPGDGVRRPAVLWAHSRWGGLSPHLWAPARAEGDHVPEAFRREGFAVMVPSFRGENYNAGRFEMFRGEVDDLLAAVEYLRDQPFVDPDRVYLAGRAQGATLVLLAAELSGRFRAAFAIGAYLDVEAAVRDPASGWAFAPFDAHSDDEVLLRSPMPWVLGVTRPTYHFDAEGAGNRRDDGRDMEALARTEGVPFRSFEVPGADGAGLVDTVAEFIVDQMKLDFRPTADPLMSVDSVAYDLQSFLDRQSAAEL